MPSVVLLAWDSSRAKGDQPGSGECPTTVYSCLTVNSRNLTGSCFLLLPQGFPYVDKPLIPPLFNSLAFFSGVGSRGKATSRMSKSACTGVATASVYVLMHCLFCVLVLPTPVTQDE